MSVVQTPCPACGSKESRFTGRLQADENDTYIRYRMCKRCYKKWLIIYAPISINNVPVNKLE